MSNISCCFPWFFRSTNVDAIHPERSVIARTHTAAREVLEASQKDKSPSQTKAAAADSKRCFIACMPLAAEEVLWTPPRGSERPEFNSAFYRATGKEEFIWHINQRNPEPLLNTYTGGIFAKQDSLSPVTIARDPPTRFLASRRPGTI